VRFCFGSELAIQSGASSVGPSEHFWRRRHRFYLSLKAPAWRRSPLALSEPLGPVIGFVVSETIPGFKVTLGRTPLMLEPPLPVSRALRWPVEDRKKTLESSTSKVLALHQEAEHDATRRILAVSILYIRGLATACKGSVATLQHPALFTEGYLSSG
jgi:hypothetical protein